jgi:hypothetical protein
MPFSLSAEGQNQGGGNMNECGDGLVLCEENPKFILSVFYGFV